MRHCLVKIFTLIFLVCSFTTKGICDDEYYERAYAELLGMLNGDQELDFKRAVFITENAYLEERLSYSGFEESINTYRTICELIAEQESLYYNGDDYRTVSTHASVFRFMTDTTFIPLNDTNLLMHAPFTYNFDDYAGKKDWTNTFVSKLMYSEQGNCHSLPILYKLIVEGMGEKAWLAFAPNHLYVKLYNKKVGWYNMELTSGNFPVDAWLMSSGYIHLDAIRNGIYMDTLSQKESVALCLVDLAQGYKAKYKKNNIFVKKCCNAVLQHYPKFMVALLVRADALQEEYLMLEDKNTEKARLLLGEIETELMNIHSLGYRKMPDGDYRQWLNELQRQKEVYESSKNYIPQ